MASFLQALLITGLPILLLAVANEFIWRERKYQSEYSRKLLHIAVGTYAAFWPWFISWRNIELLALGALCALMLSRIFDIFKSMHSARQLGTGEFLAAVSVGLVALITHDNWVFMAAILHLSLADGLAAVIGTKLGKGNVYKVLGQTRSAAGTLTFLVCSAGILTACFLSGAGSSSWEVLLWLPFAAAAAENIGVHGSDNLLVPVLVCLVLENL